jgi:hypothetical protein
LTVALIGGTATFACGGSEANAPKEDSGLPDDAAGSGGVGGSGAAGTGAAGTGAAGMGGAGVGGASNGGSSGSGGSLMPFACAGVRPPSAAITDFSGTDPQGTWGDISTGFYGGTYVYSGTNANGGPDLTALADVTAKTFRVTGRVSTYSGFGIWFGRCTNAAKYRGLSFKLTGTLGGGSLVFYVTVNETTPIDPINMIGSCPFTSEQTKFVECINPGKGVSPSGTVTILWNELTGSKPRPVDPEQIVGLQWGLIWAPGLAPYSVDLTLDDVAFVGDGVPADGSADAPEGAPRDTGPAGAD